MFESFNDFLTGKMDYLLGWMLLMPRDAMLITLAAMTSAILVVARYFFTNQEWLARALADRKRLKQLTAEARQHYRQAVAAADRQARRAARQQFKSDRDRYKATATLIKLKASACEFKPLLYSIIPIALLATWAFSRVHYVPTRVDQDVEVRLIVPTSAIGKLAYIQPQPGLDAAWVQRVTSQQIPPPSLWWDVAAAKIRASLRATYNFCTHMLPKVGILLGQMDPPKPVPRGAAVWHIKATRPGDYLLAIRYDGQSFEKDLLIGSRHYAAPIKAFDVGPVQAIELRLDEQRLFNVVGSIDWLWLPPWLVAYLLVAIPLVSVLKRLLRIY